MSSPDPIKCRKCGRISIVMNNESPYAGIERHLMEYGCPTIGRKLIKLEADVEINEIINERMSKGPTI